MNPTIVFDDALIAKYDIAGPRYTSYPTAVQFHEGFTRADYRAEAVAGNRSGAPLSLYFHIPFCATVCFYCACNKIISNNRKRAVPYLQQLHKEIALQAELFDRARAVRQLHWGGGTPTFINPQQMRDLMRVTGEHFQLLDDDSGEYSIEIDPREADAATITLLRELGFNRLSLGVQDFDPQVQQAVNRIQSLEQTQTVIDAARGKGFKSISIDLIYGLPHQTVAGFERTLDQVIAMAPDRLSVFNYAHLPGMFKVQRQIDEAALPSPAVKLDILRQVITRLSAAGYVYVGMDHFAQPGDELVRAQQNGSLYRNFQGYSTHADCDLVGLGMTAIGRIGNCYAQNAKTLHEYYSALEHNQLPLFRGVRLGFDERLRREVIRELICNFKLDFATIDKAFGVTFRDYFAAELARLADMENDGLLNLNAQGILVQPAGRLLIRNICMVFDRYLPGQQARQRFSKAI